MIEKTMKKLITLTAVFTLAFSSFNASAISASYARQLDRSGCTQQTDGNGCDIHKSKAQNASAARKAAHKHQNQTLTEVGREINAAVGMEFGEGTNYLQSHGWQTDGPGEYVKAGHRLRVITESGKIVNAQITKW